MPVRTITLLILSMLLAACGAIDSMKDGLAHSQAVSADLEKDLGLKPFVGFKWNNGSLTSVNVTFDRVPSNYSLIEIVSKARLVVLKEFKQTPTQIVVAFVVQP